MTGICIVGWAHTPFGKLPDPDTESLIAQVVGPAIEDAGIAPAEIDGIFVGQFNSGFSKQDFPSSLTLQGIPSLRFKPAMRCENACASGAAAVFAGIDFIRSGRGKAVLVVGAEKMTAATGAEVASNLLGASYRREEAGVAGGFAGIFCRVAQRYFELYGDQSDALAAIAAKNHKNGVDNPYAQIRKDLGFEFCRTVSERNPIVAGPLKRTDCSPVSDGAAALILTDAETAKGLGKAVHIRGVGQSSDYLPMSSRDLEGWTSADGRLPVNRSGGLKAKGHPVGATGVSMHVMAAMQLTGQAGAMQLPRANLGAVYNMGGSAVANYVSILERLR